MKQEIHWISLWILMSTAMTLLSLIYFYLSHELTQYGVLILSIFLLTITLPYILWKYNQVKFVDKRTIVIQILSD
ncbi:MAG TPA: hypothetical protein EYH42_06420 [Sulfurovum sp.]|nr:hypothetical protein [Sulfurovum sp.]